jgi:acetyl-CoA C-acetyltransferase
VPLDPRTPVIVGVGQALRRTTPEQVPETPEPVDFMADAARSAEADSGASGLLTKADSVRTVDLLGWHYIDPAGLLASRLGASPRQRARSATGGNSPQMLLNDAAAGIQRGDLDVVLIAGCEVVYSRYMARKNKDARFPWTEQPADTSPSEVIGLDRPGSHEFEQARSLAMPTQVYPIFENALRAASGESIDEHQEKISGLWSRFSKVAESNPYAWSPQFRTPEEIRTVSPDNRMISFPYPKLMNANMQTDQAAAIILCSVEAARAAGVPEDRWVFPWSGSDAHDHWFVSNRDNLHSSPAIRLNGTTALGLAGIGIDDVKHIDLYSCFPSAVQIGAAALGLPLDDPSRPLTVTGGLTFGGGPGNSYVTGSIATMVGRLRDDPGSVGLCTALGWYVTKHSLGVYSTTPAPSGSFQTASPQSEVDALPSVELVESYDGDAVLESYTVLHERDGEPMLGILACRTPDGKRTWANTNDVGFMKALMVEELIGKQLTIAEGLCTAPPS